MRVHRCPTDEKGSRDHATRLKRVLANEERRFDNFYRLGVFFMSVRKSNKDGSYKERIQKVRMASKNIPIPKAASAQMGFRPAIKLLWLLPFNGCSD
jgi:pyruvate formate-lyase activating enzyme-like uncharacterized protein